jgi:hypothetical protein
VPSPARSYPAGRYRAQARLLAGPSASAPALTLEIRQADTGRLIATGAARGGADKNGVLDLEADFALAAVEKVSAQVVSDGSTPVRWDYLLVRFAETPEPPLSLEVEDLWHMGTPVVDALASGGQAVELIPGHHPRDFAFSGPDRVLPAGAWVATLRYASAAGSRGGERLEATLSNVEQPLAAVSLPESSGSGGYGEIALPFTLSRPAPVRVRVFFPGRRRLVLDRIALAPG